MKKIILALGCAVALQPAPATAMDAVRDVATNKWTIALACGLLGYSFQKYVGDWLKNNVFIEKPLPEFNERDAVTVAQANRRIAEAAKIGKRNKDDGDLPDDTTTNALKCAAILSDLKGSSALGFFALTNSFNLYRSGETVYNGAAQWFNDLTPREAAISSMYVAAAIGTVLVSQKEFKDNVYAQAVIDFISRNYLRGKFMQWFTDENNHKFNKNLADVVDTSLRAYYIAQ